MSPEGDGPAAPSPLAAGAFVPAYLEVRGPDASLAAEATALVVHGILGSAANWRGFLRKLVDQAGPDDAVRRVRWIAVDLRAHGESTGAPPPHTVAACAADLEALAAALGTRFDLVLGHSFGGKVALAHARDAERPPRATWFLDTPVGGGVRPEADRTGGQDEIARVLDAVFALGEDLPPRAEVQERLIASGLSRGLAQWMTTNVRGTVDSGYRWKFDLAAVRELISDYFALNLRPFVERSVRAAGTHAGSATARPTLIRGVRGGLSDRFDASELAWQAGLPELPIYVLPAAGHWLHVDDPSGLMRLFELAAREVLDRP